MSHFALRTGALPRAAVASAYVLAAAVLLLGYARVFAAVDPITPDSRGYLYFSPDRTIGYQAVLAALGRLSGELAVVQATQLLAVGLCVAAAAYALYRLTGSALAGLAVLLLTLGYPAPIKSAMQITTEAMSMACNAAFAAIVIAALARPRRWSLPALGVLLFVAITLRPTNAGLLLAALLAAWLGCLGTRRLRAAALLVACTALGMVATPLADGLLAAGRPGDSPAARGLFGAALLAPGPGDAEAAACGTPAFDAVLSPVKRHLAGAEGDVRDYLALNYTNYLRFRRLIPQIMAERGLGLRAQANPQMMCYARDRLTRNPGYLVARVARNYWLMVSYQNYDRPGFKQRLEDYLARAPAPLPPPIAFPPEPDAGLRLTAPWRTPQRADRASSADSGTEAGNPFSPQPARNRWLTLVLSLTLLAGAAISLLALVAALVTRGRSPALKGLAVCGAAIHSVLMATALFEIPLARYLYPLWPLIALTLVWAGTELVRRRRRPALATG